MKNSTTLIIIGIFLAGFLSFLFFSPQLLIYQLMGPEAMHDFVVKTRDYGIKKAGERGDYRCCIEPPCTMCYMEGNKWNYGEAGKCFCDDFVAKGEEPCPQCAKAISCDSEPTKEGEASKTCDVLLE